MSPTTFDLERIRQQIRSETDSRDPIVHTLGRWWSTKYQLPPNHELFRSRTPASLLREMLEDSARRREDILDRIRHGDRDPELPVILGALEELLGYKKPDGSAIITGDAMVDLWERELSAGRIPESLTRGLVKRSKPKPKVPKKRTAE